ncbi:hypothetical protein Pmani_035469 [Petrolisthes manimaculis]|uniref:Peptidase S1 domain-containing protein n=1 Tax=Petrolisthes manimaculis TaxID=1843537 RepID=A0AAE1NKJ8_9EUCA|nr:hypothetical protein Pmani_035469 [Petrolisthes manimaculis]
MRWSAAGVILLVAVSGVWGRVAPRVGRLQDKGAPPPRLDRSRIVGGQVTTQGQFPSVVSLQHRGLFGSTHVCGGTILNENHVLTAAQCVKGYSAGSFDIVAGEQSLDFNSGVEEVVRSQHLELHDYSTTTGANDIAIVRTSSPLTLVAGRAEATPLPTNYQEPAPGTMCTVVGWGYTEDGGSLSSELRYVEVPYLTDQKCMDIYGPEAIFLDMICAGYTGGRGVCDGDAGGPLFCEGVQIGVVSWGQDCDANPFVSTQVSHYIDWITIFINS